MSKAAADRVRAEVLATPVVLYMRGSSAFPLCGFSSAIVQILDHLNVRYRAIDVNADSTTRQGIRIFSDWPAVPQLYIRAHFVGGADIVQDLYATGQLQELLASAGVLP
jgi:monothiol glutaredoxin